MKKTQEQEEQEEIEPPPKHQGIEAPPPVQKPMVQTPKSILPLHALDPANHNILPQESALFPYNPQKEQK